MCGGVGWGDFSASVKSDCTCFHLQHPCGVSSPKLISHFASSQPDSFSILRHSPAHFGTLPRSCNLCVHRLRGQAAAGGKGRGTGRGGRNSTTEEASPDIGRHTSTSQAQVNSQQASHPSTSAAPTFSWAPQPYLSHQPSPTSNYPPSHLHSNQNLAAPQEVGDKTCPRGPPSLYPPIPALVFQAGMNSD